MGPDNRTVDHVQAVLGLLGQSIEYLFPDAALRPAIVAIIASRIRPVPFRQIAPRATRAQHIENAV